MSIELFRLAEPGEIERLSEYLATWNVGCIEIQRSPSDEAIRVYDPKLDGDLLRGSIRLYLDKPQKRR